MTHYNKGANAERELMKLLAEKGHLVARVAGSGKNPLDCPDLIVAAHGKPWVIECKAVNANKLYISTEQIEGIRKWQKKGFTALIAWKIHRTGWFFCHVYSDLVKPTGKNYVIDREEMIVNAIRVHPFW